MKIQERIVSIKRHTLGYVVDGQEYTRNQAIKLARRGQIAGVRVVSGVAGKHLIGSARSLYSLPTRMGRGPRFASRLSK